MPLAGIDAPTELPGMHCAKAKQSRGWRSIAKVTRYAKQLCVKGFAPFRSSLNSDAGSFRRRLTCDAIVAGIGGASPKACKRGQTEQGERTAKQKIVRATDRVNDGPTHQRTHRDGDLNDADK